MYEGDLREMAERLEKAGLLIPVLEPEMAVKQAAECMQKFWENRVAFVWDVNDVLGQAEVLDEHGKLLEDAWLDKDDASNILQTMLDRHDASIGISWDVIDVYLWELKREKESEKEGD